MGDARHLGGDCGERLAPEMLVLGILGDVSAIMFPECVVALPDRDLGRQPEGAPQSGVAELGQLGLAAEGAGLMGREIEPAELEELAMMAKAAQIAGLGENGQGDEGSDTRELAQPGRIWIVEQESLGLGFDLVALAQEASALGKNHAEHCDRRRIEPYRQGRRTTCCLVNIGQKPGLRDLAADEVPRGLDERFLGENRNAGWRREPLEEVLTRSL